MVYENTEKKKKTRKIIKFYKEISTFMLLVATHYIIKKIEF